MRSKTLPEVCAMQWVRCVQRADDELLQFDVSRVHHLRYEDFVTDPHHEVERVAAFLGAEIHPGKHLRRWVTDVTPQYVGKWTSELDQKTVSLVEPLIHRTLKRYGYVSM